MKLIVGLGNPGIEYQFTPHNMGFLAVDRIAEEYGVRIANRHCRALTGKVAVRPVTKKLSEEILLAKPETFMNLSGMAVRELVAKYEADPARDLIVLHDELAFPLGTLRVHERGSGGGHNGVESVIAALGTQSFVRVRLGVAPDREVRDGTRYLLGQFKKSQYRLVDEALDRAAQAVQTILLDGVAKAMNIFNQRPRATAE